VLRGQFLDTEDRDDVVAEGDTFLDGAPASLRCEDAVASPNGVRSGRCLSRRHRVTASRVAEHRP
jgi:hypothetical protein